MTAEASERSWWQVFRMPLALAAPIYAVGRSLARRPPSM
jgi:hypothetical protein